MTSAVMVWALIAVLNGSGKEIERIAEYPTQAECQVAADIASELGSVRAFCIEAMKRN